MLRRLALGFAFIALPLAGHAQFVPNGSNAVGLIGRDTASGLPCYIGGAATCIVPGGGTFTAAPAGATSAQTGSTVATHLTFQSALAASSARKGCLITNTSSDKEWVFFGATGSATTSNSLPLVAGQSLSCNTGAIVLTDNVAITSNVTDGAAFVAISQ